MDTLYKYFGNLISNHRFVFQGEAAPQKPVEAPETKVPEEGTETIGEATETADIQVKDAEKKGGEATQRAEKQVKAYIDPETGIIMMSETKHVEVELTKKQKRILNKIKAKLEKGKKIGPEALKKRMAKWETRTEKNADVKAALDAWKAQRTEQPVESAVDSVEKQTSEILAQGGDEIGKKTLQALGSHYKKLASLKEGPREIYKELVSRIASVNKTLIQRGATVDGFKKFNSDLADLIAKFENLNEPQELASNATAILNLADRASTTRDYDNM